MPVLEVSVSRLNVAGNGSGQKVKTETMPGATLEV